jgi:phosphodiesterase/alkaline phosphatase D-like protein
MLPTGKFTDPANLIGEPSSSNITTKRAQITWSTDRASDSKIAIGTQSGQYSAAEIGNSDQVSVHSIDLDNLAAGTTYYYVVKWTDADGNTGISQENTFKTSPAPVIKEVVTTKVGLSEAVVAFTSVNAVQIKLYFGVSDSFGGLQTINTSTTESNYSMSLVGLNDGTKYFYQISAIDSEGSEYRGNIFSFSTPQRPRISSLQFEPIQGEPTSTQSVTWKTNVAGTSTVTYGKIGTNGINILNSELVTDHQVEISGLEDDS